MYLKEFIVTTELTNINPTLHPLYFDASSSTHDLIFLDSKQHHKNIFSHLDGNLPGVPATDYAIMNYTRTRFSMTMHMDRRIHTNYWLRDPDSTTHHVATVGYNTNNSPKLDDGDFVTYSDVGIRPLLNLDLKKVITARLLSSQNFPIYKTKDGYHVIQYGHFPQTKASNSEQLEQLFQNNELTPTGKTYTGCQDYNKSTLTENKEYMFQHKFYVRTTVNNTEIKQKFHDDTEVKNGKIEFVQVQPLEWIIVNWDDMPTTINPNGNGTATTFELITKNVILAGIPFCLEVDNWSNENYINMWQNSIIRAYLNGYDIYEELSKHNGNVQYQFALNYNFKDNNFLSQALDDNIIMPTNTSHKKTRLEILESQTTQTSSNKAITDTDFTQL